MIHTVASSNVTVIIGETGSGKSTQIAPYLLDAAHADRNIADDARNERITRAEVKSLGGKMVNFWQTFCLLRASLPGPVAPGELEVCHKLKNLLEDGQVVTEQVVHDIMMLFPEDLIQSNKRVKALVALLQRTAEDVDVENVMTF